MCFLIFRRLPLVKSVRRQQQQQHESGVGEFFKKRVDGISPSTTIRRLDHSRSENSECGERVEKWTKNASIVQDYFSNWIQSYPLENERNIGDKVVFTKISSSFTEAGKT